MRFNTTNINSNEQMIHWPSIRNAVLFSVFMLGGSAALLFVTNEIKSSLYDRLNGEEKRLKDIQRRHEDTRKETRLIEQYHEKYQELVESRFIGNEDRLNWVETIRKIRAQRNLPELNYIFQPVKPIPNPGKSPAGYFQLYATKSTLQFTLYDETDLQAIFQQLAQTARGYFTVDSCEIRRIKKELQLNKAGNIHGNCKLTWLSIRKAGAHDNAGISG